MPSLTIRVDAETVTGWLGEVNGNVRYWTAVALNRTGEDANAALRPVMQQQFTIRDPRLPQWVAPLRIPPENRATKQELSVIVDTEGKGLLLAPFEEGVTKEASSADNALAVPTTALRTTKATIIARKMYPINLGFVARRDPSGALYYALGKGSLGYSTKRGYYAAKTPIHRTAAGATQIKGKQRTFILDPRYAKNINPNQWGVYQRFGPKRGDIRMLWRLTEQVHRPKILLFVATVEQAVAARWYPNMTGALALAIETAR